MYVYLYVSLKSVSLRVQCFSCWVMIERCKYNVIKSSLCFFQVIWQALMVNSLTSLMLWLLLVALLQLKYTLFFINKCWLLIPLFLKLD